MEERVNSHLLRLIAQRATRASPGKKSGENELLLADLVFPVLLAFESGFFLVSVCLVEGWMDGRARKSSLSSTPLSFKALNRSKQRSLASGVRLKL